MFFWLKFIIIDLPVVFNYYCKEPLALSEEKKSNIPSEDELKKNWQPSKYEGIYKKPKEQSWICVKCGQVMNDPRSVGFHSEEHNPKAVTSTSQHHTIETPEDMLQMREQDLKMALESEHQDLGGTDESPPDYDLINFDLQSQYKISNLIVNHPQFKFVFTDLRRKREIYPQWDYATWIFECVNFWITIHGIKPSAGIPRELAVKNPMIASFLKNVAEEWKKHEAELMKVEAQ